MKYDTVIFDLDGTLLYTLESLQDSTNYALLKFGFPSRNIEEIKTFVGNGVEKLIKRALPINHTQQEFDLVFGEFKTHYQKTMYSKTRPYENVLELLKTLKENNIKCAVVSNKYDNAVKELCEKYFPNLIDITLGENETIPKKPSPIGVQEVIKLLNSKSSIYIGDSEVDIQTAQNANIQSISVSWGYKSIDFLKKHNAQKIVNTPKELLSLILE